jgi:hypothetical protein
MSAHAPFKQRHLLTCNEHVAVDDTFAAREHSTEEGLDLDMHATIADEPSCSYNVAEAFVSIQVQCGSM